MPKDLKPWYAVAIPHEDIQKGRLSEAVFAANLWAVVQKTAPDIYTDPEAFFRKTYLTSGLTHVLRMAAGALTGKADAGDRILSLQTAFGGGKTHALVALWHLAKHSEKIGKSSACAELRQALGDSLPKKVNAIAVFTNQTCDATQGRKSDEGVRTRTMWGELALQLGGKKTYKMVEVNDQNRSVPQGLFAEILRETAPCLILLDEVADYCVGASAVEVGAATLADQTISFVQQLTEAAQQVPGVAVVATLPASRLEVAGSEKGHEILNSLERRFGRMSADNTPVADSEIYEVVRRRLFESLGDMEDHDAVAEAFMKMYQQHRNEVPAEATRGAFKEQMVRAYPFHPSLIDALYLRWGSHGDFQRTRGVLRLLASIVADLWQKRKAATQLQLLIQPSHVRWSIDALHAALTRLWGGQFESVVAHDVIGNKANAVLLDEERGEEYRRERIVEGLASAILLGSFGGQAEKAGYSTKDIKFCVGRPGLNWGFIDGALLALDERAFFLHGASAGSQGKRYWFGTKPTLNKLVAQYRMQMSSQDFDADIIEALREQGQRSKGSATWQVLVAPEADLPEQKSLTLLVMPPDLALADDSGQDGPIGSSARERLMTLSSKCGKRDRHYRNTLLFLLPSSRGLLRLRNAFREVEVLEAVQRDYGGQLDADQMSDLKNRAASARKAAAETMSAAYTQVARVEGQKLVASALTDTRAALSEHLDLIWKHVVDDEEWVLRKIGTVTLQKVGLIPDQSGIRVKDAVEAFLRYTDKPMIASRQAVLDGLAQACKEKLIGIARGLNLNDIQRKWCGTSVTLEADEEGLWIIPPFADSPEKDREKPPVDKKGTPEGVKSPGGEPVEEPVAGRKISRIRIKGNVPMENWSELFRCFVGPAARLSLKKLDLGIEFEMTPGEDNPIGENHPNIKAMTEAAHQLGLEISFDD